MKITFKKSIIEDMINGFENFQYDENEIEKFETLRKNFVYYFNSEKIKNLKKEEYFEGLGKKEGCLTYEIEHKLRKLGSIRGGSNSKFGTVEDFPLIKDLLLETLKFKDSCDSFYLENGDLTQQAKKICQMSRKIKGMVTGRTTIGKILSLYYPLNIIPIFRDQSHYVSQIILDFETETKGTEKFFYYNYLLLKIREAIFNYFSIGKTDIYNIYKFYHFLYNFFPFQKTTIITELDVENDKEEITNEDEPFETLERDHYQTLIHRNFKRLFGDELNYYEPEYQNENNGHFQTEDAGTMDYLCLDKNNNFVVIELKRKGTDTTVGQILRYMGWVNENLCKQSQLVKGIILADKKDITMDYALKIANSVEFRRIDLKIDIRKDQ